MDMKDFLNNLEKLTLEEKLYLVQFDADEESHLKVDQDKCGLCEHKICTIICPAGNYTINEDTGEIVVSYEGCFECGTCRIACEAESIDWEYPRGGFGVCYRYG